MYVYYDNRRYNFIPLLMVAEAKIKNMLAPEEKRDKLRR